MENAPVAEQMIILADDGNNVDAAGGMEALPKAPDGRNSRDGRGRSRDLAIAPPSPPNASSACRLRVTNLPKFYGMAELKKYFLSKFGVTVKQIKPVKDRVRGNTCFVTFSNEEGMRIFQEKLATCTFKGKVLKAQRADHAPDKFHRAVERNSHRRETNTARRRGSSSSQVSAPQAAIVDIVAPLHAVPYDPEQLRMKQAGLVEILKKYGELFKNKAQNSMPWLEERLKQNGGLLCELKPVVGLPHEAPNGTTADCTFQQGSAERLHKCLYRNKCEFSFGYNAEKKIAVGFRVAKFRQGNLEVESPERVPFVSPAMKRIVQHMHAFLHQHAEFSLPFDEVRKTGHYRQLTVRENRQGHLLVAIYMHPQGLSVHQLDALSEDLQKHFSAAADSTEPSTSNESETAFLNVQSLIFVSASGNMPTALVKDSLTDLTRILFGCGYIEEMLLGLTFRISHTSFFQTNAYGAENLYQTILAACATSSGGRGSSYSAMLDLCCGTGTISLLAAKNVTSLKRIIGIELNADAVRDARHNADFNGLMNNADGQQAQLEFIAAPVEAALPSIANKISAEYDISQAPPRAVAVLDPPRSGVQVQVVDALRKCDAIERIVYAACAPSNEQVMQNFYRLCRCSRDAPGDAFVPVYAVPVDLFPFTKHCELIVVFDRHRDSDDEPTKNGSNSTAGSSSNVAEAMVMGNKTGPVMYSEP